MTVASEKSLWNENYFAALAEKKLQLPQALAAWQANMQANFLAQGFPSRKIEEWKYSSLDWLVEEKFALAPAAASLYFQQEKLAEAYCIEVVNGQLQKPAALPPGVLLAPIETLFSDQKQLLMLAESYETVCSQLNAALLTHGLFLYIPKHTVLSQPIHIRHLTTAAEPAMFHPRHVLLMDEYSQCCIVEEYAGQGERYFQNVVTQIVVQEQATVTHVKIQREDQAAIHVANTVFTQAAHSTVNSWALSLGARFNRENLNFNLHAQGASAHLYGLYLPLMQQHIDYHTCIDHRVPHCFSEQVYKGIIDSSGVGVFNGKIVVHEQAQKTIAYQTNQNLLLAQEAKVYAKPELQIYANDVKCSHGATIGQLDEQALFYFRSRGISLQDARHMLIHAFAEELFTHKIDPVLADYLKLVVQRKFGGTHE